MGGLRARLRNPSALLGFIALTGPRGSGGSRMLEEVESMLLDEGRRAPLRVYPQPEPERVPFGALREAIAQYLDHPSPPVGLRMLRTLLTGSDAEVDVLAGWLFGVRLEAVNVTPGTEQICDLLSRLIPVGPVLADRFHELDEQSQDVLLGAARGRVPGVVAVMDKTPVEVPEENRFALEPLAPSQIELMLKRWIKHAATSRRLAAGLAKSTEGHPGRLASAVRELAGVGILQRSERGIVFTRDPGVWPDGQVDQELQPPMPWRYDGTHRDLLDLAAVAGGRVSPELLAGASGVKPAVVREYIQEAVARRSGRTPGCLFGTKTARKQWLDQVARGSWTELRERLVAAAKDCRPTPGDHVLLAALAADLCQYEASVEFLSAVDPDKVRLPDLRAQLARGARHFGTQVVPEPVRERAAKWVQSLLGPSGRRRDDLHAALRSQTAVRIGAALAGRAHLRPQEIDDLRAKFEQGDTDLGSRLVRADFETLTGNIEGARKVLRELGRELDPGDLEARAAWHRALATLANRTGRPHGESSHLRRMARLARAQGHHKMAAEAWARLGEGGDRPGAHPHGNRGPRTRGLYVEHPRRGGARDPCAAAPRRVSRELACLRARRRRTVPRPRALRISGDGALRTRGASRPRPGPSRPRRSRPRASTRDAGQ